MSIFDGYPRSTAKEKVLLTSVLFVLFGFAGVVIFSHDSPRTIDRLLYYTSVGLLPIGWLLSWVGLSRRR